MTRRSGPGGKPVAEPEDAAAQSAGGPSGAPVRGFAGHARETQARAPEPYTVALSRQARRNLHENLPTEVAIAATETITGAIATNPYRVGKPLNEPLDGYYSARRGTYRIIYRIDEPKRVVEIHSIRHRRDVYRS